MTRRWAGVTPAAITDAIELDSAFDQAVVEPPEQLRTIAVHTSTFPRIMAVAVALQASDRASTFSWPMRCTSRRSRAFGDEPARAICVVRSAMTIGAVMATCEAFTQVCHNVGALIGFGLGG